jgi:hypothetical protein
VLELKIPPHNLLLGKLWSAVEPVYTEAALQAATSTSGFKHEDAVAPAIDQSLRRLASGWKLPVPPAHVAWTPPADTARSQDEVEFSWVGETARHVGSVVHRWLQRIADEQMKAWDAPRIAALRTVFRRELMARGLAEADLDGALERVIQALEHAVTDERGRWLLGPQQDARSELRITARLKNENVNLVIDRTFMTVDGVRWIADYKTSSHEGSDVDAFLDRERLRYEAQLARYAAALDEPRTKLGLYFPLLAGWREWES